MNDDLIVGLVSAFSTTAFLVLIYFQNKFIKELKKSREFYREQYLKIYQDIEDAGKVVDKIGFLNRRFDERAKDVDKYLEDAK